LLKPTVATNCAPTTAVPAAAPSPVSVMYSVWPAVTKQAAACWNVFPPKLNVIVVVVALDVPVFLSERYAVPAAGMTAAQPGAAAAVFPTTAVMSTALPLTCAVLVNDPKRPNTNPATAMAAMRVIAMRMTVGNAIKN